MNPRLNPFIPVCGVAAERCVGRAVQRQRLDELIGRLARGRLDSGMTLTGLRGCGKTTLLLEAAQAAESAGLASLVYRCRTNRPFLEGLLAALRSALLRFGSGVQAPRHDPSGGDALAMLVTLAKARSGLLVCIDDAHRLTGRQWDDGQQLLHAAYSQRLAIGVLLAGLPGVSLPMHREEAGGVAQLRIDLPLLPPAAAAELLVGTALSQGLKFETTALAMLVSVAAGHPLVLQQFGASAWLLADSTPVRLATAQRAVDHAWLQLDAEFYNWRQDRLGPQERRYLQAMAQLGEGPHRSGDIAAQLRRPVTALAPTRSALIAKELLYSPRYGETAFTTHGYFGYLHRT